MWEKKKQRASTLTLPSNNDEFIRTTYFFDKSENRTRASWDIRKVELEMQNIGFINGSSVFSFEIQFNLKGHIINIPTAISNAFDSISIINNASILIDIVSHPRVDNFVKLKTWVPKACDSNYRKLKVYFTKFHQFAVILQEEQPLFCDSHTADVTRVGILDTSNLSRCTQWTVTERIQIFRPVGLTQMQISGQMNHFIKMISNDQIMWPTMIFIKRTSSMERMKRIILLHIIWLLCRAICLSHFMEQCNRMLQRHHGSFGINRRNEIAKFVDFYRVMQHHSFHRNRKQVRILL